jgi:hypothetical protein
MKKILVVMLGMMLLAAPAFAANNDAVSTDTPGHLTIGGTNKADATPSAQLTIGLSPKVVARYVNTAATTEITSQWYALATVHPGGSIGYATAQDVNNIYMKWFNTGDDTDTITGNIQESKVDTTGLEGDELAAAQATMWDGQGWSTTAPTAAPQ